MLIGCPECYGRRTMRYRMFPQGTNRAVQGSSIFEETSTEVEEPCRTCKGQGRVESSTLSPKFRIPVLQRLSKNGEARVIGSVPPNFDPARIKSTNYFYTPRPGDFTRVGDAWEASHMLGDGDLEAVPGFVWDRSHYERGGSASS